MLIIKGKPELVEAVRNDSIEFYGMDGDGCQAPGAIVIREQPHNQAHPFVVHFANTQSGGYGGGEYCETLESAQARFVDKCTRYDPAARLNASFNARL